MRQLDNKQTNEQSFLDSLCSSSAAPQWGLCWEGQTDWGPRSGLGFPSPPPSSTAEGRQEKKQVRLNLSVQNNNNLTPLNMCRIEKNTRNQTTRIGCNNLFINYWKRTRFHFQFTVKYITLLSVTSNLHIGFYQAALEFERHKEKMFFTALDPYTCSLHI